MLSYLLCLFSAVNEYVFMVQARGIQIRENMRNIGAQVLEQVVRGAYSLNGTGKQAAPPDHRKSGECFNPSSNNGIKAVDVPD